jgi:hypothetical protein
MSDLLIGMVVEGPTDALVLEAGLSAFLQASFTSVTMQPQTPPGKSGAGWSGVFWWCRQLVSQGYATLSESPTVQQLDLIIIQVDADVAGMTYESANIDDPPYDDLPCEYPCPPASKTVRALYNVVVSWMRPTQLGAKAVICIPSKCIEAWVAAALYGSNDPDLVENLECSFAVETYLQAKPARERLIRRQGDRLRKVTRKFRGAQQTISTRWKDVKNSCPQAAQFQHAVEAALA